ncbi:UNVERIFIED_CONTAM: Phytochrome A [Sesamum latifolium]|uniref:Phytochrome A n=1 Tax=Sesamum latifolium TaxID=2727402 RepID=A0AAW2TNA5_9LAMI
MPVFCEQKVGWRGCGKDICFLQLASHEFQQALFVQRLSEKTAMKRSRVLSYVAKEIWNPLSGIIFSQKMMEGTHADDEEKSLLHTSLNC